MLCLRSITHETHQRSKRIAEKQKNKNQSTNTMIPPPLTARLQIKSAKQLHQLRIIKLNAFLAVGARQQLERASLQSLIPNAKPIEIPKQNLDPVAVAIHEQE
jgi:hypothetical protein